MIFIETAAFSRVIVGLLADDQYARFQLELAASPTVGDVIEGTGGLRKVRLAIPGRGKRGGARVIYYYIAPSDRIILLLVYPKNAQDALTQAQKAALRSIIENWR
ncbi:type II toxin-antitoxin system RelE/ParE family toxin [Stenotrophomonas sp. AB1(2024)]|uniref:type II toxin-antitoxin system RelE/ParE family toxin n=1 Tax=Stenotrophomonas sp. AB1(2024) TaxID=3132215 RepID=UPI0030A6C06E